MNATMRLRKCLGQSNMKILLDTHIALWAVADTAKLSEAVISLLENESNKVFYSIASVWEVAIHG